VNIDGESIGIAQLLKLAGLVASTSEAFRTIEQGGIKLNGEKISDKGLTITRGAEIVAQVGKRKFAKIKIM
ncbi:MAG TPA: RNA-binding S4 domain-containing protein, partial [Methylobacter sp.]